LISEETIGVKRNLSNSNYLRKFNIIDNKTEIKIDITSKTSLESWNILRRISIMTYDSVTTI
jgi:hypothetical protein